MLSDFKDQSLFTQQIGSLYPLPEPVLSRALSILSPLIGPSRPNKDLWLAKGGQA